MMSRYHEDMELKPTEPPGHGLRKLRGFGGEIQRLRAMGYSIEAIRKALLDVGVSVSWQTVSREAARLKQASTPQPHPSTPHTAHDGASAQGGVASNEAPVKSVDEIFSSIETNPLFRRKAKKP